MVKKIMTRKDFIVEWCRAIQGNIWKNEEILAGQIERGEDDTKQDATKHNIEQETTFLQSMMKRNEIDNI